MAHTAKLIKNPGDYANQITHRDPQTEAAKRELFVEQNKIVSLGTMGIAFSVICCDDIATVERYTLGNVHALSKEDVTTLVADKVKKAAERHNAVAAHLEHAAALAEANISPQNCGCE